MYGKLAVPLWDLFLNLKKKNSAISSSVSPKEESISEQLPKHYKGFRRPLNNIGTKQYLCSTPLEVILDCTRERTGIMMTTCYKDNLSDATRSLIMCFEGFAQEKWFVIFFFVHMYENSKLKGKGILNLSVSQIKGRVGLRFVWNVLEYLFRFFF